LALFLWGCYTKPITKIYDLQIQSRLDAGKDLRQDEKKRPAIKIKNRRMSDYDKNN